MPRGNVTREYLYLCLASAFVLDPIRDLGWDDLVIIPTRSSQRDMQCDSQHLPPDVRLPWHQWDLLRTMELVDSAPRILAYWGPSKPDLLVEGIFGPENHRPISNCCEEWKPSSRLRMSRRELDVLDFGRSSWSCARWIRCKTRRSYTRQEVDNVEELFGGLTLRCYGAPDSRDF